MNLIKFKDYYNLREETVPAVKNLPDTVSMHIGNTEYELEVADTQEKIYQGLSGRKDLPRKTGMIFVLPMTTIQSFCMRDCNFDIDLIYLSEAGQIVGLHRMKQERKKMSKETNVQYNNRLVSYESIAPAKYAIEIPSGDITRLGLKLGQSLNLPNL